LVNHDEKLIGRIWCDRYELLELIGKGGMGTVFKARQIKIDREVALKVIHRKLTHDEKSVQRFEKEALASSKLHHPNNIRVYDYGKSDDERLFIAMEFLRGQTLGDLISHEGPLDPSRVVHISRQIGKSLAEANQVGLVHRDLKPENIFICDIHGEPDFVKVLDYGIAKAVGGEGEHANLTQTGFICGTPRYISPEQALGQPVDGRSDLYAMAVLMYEMLTGRPPFMGENPISIVMMHVYDDPPPLVGMERYGLLGKRLTRLVGHMLEKNPNRRPPSAESVIRFLDGRIDETELVGRAVSDPIPVLGAAEVHSTANATSAPPIPAFNQVSTTSPEKTDPSAAPIVPEETTNRGLAGPVAGIVANSDDSTMMVPAVFGTPKTQSDVATAFTEQPSALRPEAAVSDTAPSADVPSVLSGISADETTQLPAEQLQEAVDLLKKRRSNPKGLVRRRPSSSLNLKGVKRQNPPTPTPSGSTGLNLRTLPPTPQTPTPPFWALATMGVAIAVISVSLAALVFGNQNKNSDQVHTDRQGADAQKEQKERTPSQPAASAVDPQKVEKTPVSAAIATPKPASQPVVEEVVPPEPTTAGSLVGEQLAALEILKSENEKADEHAKAALEAAPEPVQQARPVIPKVKVDEPKVEVPEKKVAEPAPKSEVIPKALPVPKPKVSDTPKPVKKAPKDKVVAKPKEVPVKKPAPTPPVKKKKRLKPRGWTF
jgi:serine/threonine protein kinase